MCEKRQLVQHVSQVLVPRVCSMSSASGGATGSLTSRLLPSEPCLAPSLEQQEWELTVALGQPVRLCCGRAERGGHWYKEGVRLAPAGRVRGWRGRLEIASFLPEDAGRYLCLARGSLIVLHNLTLIADESLTSSNNHEDPKIHRVSANGHVYTQQGKFDSSKTHVPTAHLVTEKRPIWEQVVTS